MDAAHDADGLLERQTIARVTRRLMPLLMLAYLCSYLDRANIGMAALTMNRQLGLSPATFGFGAGLFSIGYILAEIPSTLVLNLVGARRWIARIMMTWGLVSGLTAFVWNGQSFYGARILLGLAEGGFYPGVVLYLSWWYPGRYRARMMALFQSASVISLVIGLPIGGALMQLDGLQGLHGWQWLLLLEALPSLIMSLVIWRLLTDRPAQAVWLRPEQRHWLERTLEGERAGHEAAQRHSLGGVFTNPVVWMLTLAYVGQNISQYGLILFMPTIIQGLGVSRAWIGVVSAIPFLFALVTMLAWGWHSDAKGERTWHCASACLLCAAGMSVCILVGAGHPVVTAVALVLAEIGQQSIALTFWAIPTSMLAGAAAAGGIALIQSVGQLGSLLGPWAFGWIREESGSNAVALLCLAAAPALSAVLVVLVGHRGDRPRPGRRAGANTAPLASPAAP